MTMPHKYYYIYSRRQAEHLEAAAAAPVAYAQLYANVIHFNNFSWHFKFK